MLPVRNFWKLGVGTVMLGGVMLSFILGPDRVSRETRAAVKRAEQAFDESLSNAQLLASAEEELKDHNKQDGILSEHLVEVENRILDAKDVIGQRQNEVEQHQGVLRLAKLKLVSQSDLFEINGRTLTRTVIERDVALRLQLCRDANAQIAFEQDTLRQLEQLRSEISGNLDELRATRQEKARQLELLAVRLKNAEVQEQLQELKQKFVHPAGDKTKYEKSVAEIERRIRNAERQAKGGAGDQGDLIDWTSNKRDYVAEIDAQLNQVPTATAKVAKN